ncbi:hypothetical protein NW768_010937 [Fusarium equiseti]|uniref:F-box domain-containing protein n=1 Tax=Fusarium equiseti TaxID=61235 RepID=A0ABQ8QZ76_FUSEQ|nr:hypothetical protein NW768_010937 [Fusarium equiseti]
MTSTIHKGFLGALPTELCLQVLHYLKSKTAISSLIRASPRMLQVYLSYKAEIIWHILASDFDREMIQDAIFIIQLPRSTGPVYVQGDYEPCKAVADLWFAKQLPDPIAFQDKSSQLFWSLNKLHSVLIRLIEDYVTKAKSEYLVRSYPCLPQMGPSQRHLTFRGNKVMTRMDAGLLQQSERKKLLRYFILYEWIAKAMRAQHIFWMSNRDFDKLMPTRRGHSFSDEKAWFSVEAYVASLYHAIFAQITEGRLPEPEKDFCPNTGILHPRFASTSPAIYSTFSQYGSPYAYLPENLAIWGLDLLFAFLSLDVSHADDMKLIEDHFGANVTEGGYSSSWYIARAEVEYTLENDVMLRVGAWSYNQVSDWRAWEFLYDAKPHDHRQLETRHWAQWAYKEKLDYFHIETTFHRRCMARKGNYTRQRGSPLPQLVKSYLSALLMECAVVEQSPAFWRVGLRGL